MIGSASRLAAPVDLEGASGLVKERTLRKAALPLVLLLAAFWLRLFRLGYQPVWYDEVYSIAVASHPASEIAGWIYRDNHPALYWFALYPVVHLLGDTEFLVRLPSALLGTATVALVYAAGRQMWDSHRVGLLAALWLTVSPIHVVYSQEARMYVPLALFGLASTLFLYRGSFRGKWFNWVLFGVAAAATAHSHNYGLLLLAAQDCWALCHFQLRRDRHSLKGLGLGHLVFAILYAPMVSALLAQLRMPVGSTGVATLHDVLDAFEAFGAGFAGFSTPGLTPNALMEQTALPAVALTAGLILLGLVVAGRSDAKKGWAAALAAATFLLPIVALYGYSTLSHSAVWQVRGFQMAIGCFALLAGAGLAGLRFRALRWTALLTVVAVAAVNLYSHYFERYKSTVPDAVAAMEGQLDSDDVIFVAPDWVWLPFRYYYHGDADAIGGRSERETFRFVGVGADYADLIEPRELATDPAVRHPVVSPQEFEADEYARVWTVGHLATPQNVLDLFGDDVVVMHYDISEQRWQASVYPSPEIAHPSGLPAAVATPDVQWEGDLRLLGYTLPRSPIVGQEAELTLFWTVDRPQGRRRYLEIRLVDGSGKMWLSQVAPLTSLLHSVPMISLGIASDFPITAWPPGAVVAQDIGLNLRADLPPISYQISLRVVDAATERPLTVGGEREVILDTLSVGRPPRPYRQRALTVQHRANIRFGELHLSGYDLPETEPRPGHYLPFVLHWTADAAPAADYEAQVRLLGRGDAVVAETSGAPSTPAFPTSSWQMGDLVEGEIVIPLPPQMEGGDYRLALRLVNARTDEPMPGRRAWLPWAQEWVTFGRAEIAPWPLITEPPPMAREVGARFGEAAHLLGYDLAGELAPGAELDITLYWQVEAVLERSCKVFVHLSDDEGTLVAQVDGIPADWMRPTTTWRPGEVIADPHTLSLPEDLAAGTYRLYVGLYDPNAGGVRLPVTFQGQSIPDGRLPLGPTLVLGER